MLALVTSCMSPVFAADRPADTVTASEITIGSDGSLSLEELRQAAKEELAKIDLSDFSDDLPVRHLLENAIENARADIEKAREESEIRKTLESVRTLIEERKAEKAKEEEATKALSEAKKNANAELDAIDQTRYIEPEKKAVSRATSDGKATINTATGIDAVNAALSDAKEKIAKQPVCDPSLPKPASKKATVAKKKNALTARWKKLSSKKRKKITGFQVQIDTNKNFTTKPKLRTVKGKTRTSVKIKSLKWYRTYYFRVRTYKIDSGGVKTVGNWSKPKKTRLI